MWTAPVPCFPQNVPAPHDNSGRCRELLEQLLPSFFQDGFYFFRLFLRLGFDHGRLLVFHLSPVTCFGSCIFLWVAIPRLKRYVCVSMEPRRRRIGAVIVLPYTEFLEELWSGGYA